MAIIASMSSVAVATEVCDNGSYLEPQCCKADVVDDATCIDAEIRK
jgi:hypothetical protein